MVNNLVFGWPHSGQVRIMSDRKLSVDLRRLWLYLRSWGGRLREDMPFLFPKKLMEQLKVFGHLLKAGGNLPYKPSKNVGFAGPMVCENGR